MRESDPPGDALHRIAISVDVVMFRELSIIGSFGMQAARYPEMFDMVRSGKVNPGLLVGDTVGLEDTSDVLDSMTTYETLPMPVITRF